MRSLQFEWIFRVVFLLPQFDYLQIVGHINRAGEGRSRLIGVTLLSLRKRVLLGMIENQVAHMQALSAKFREENGSIVCRELLERAKTAATSMPAERDASYYKKRPCAELVACAARLIEENIEKSAD